MLELLLVLAVLGILVGYYFSRGTGSQASRSTYDHTMKKGQSAACAANRTAMRTNLEFFRMNNPRAAITTDSLRQSGIILPQCPEGGTMVLSADGTVVCPNHPSS